MIPDAKVPWYDLVFQHSIGRNVNSVSMISYDDDSTLQNNNITAFYPRKIE